MLTALIILRYTFKMEMNAEKNCHAIIENCEDVRKENDAEIMSSLVQNNTILSDSGILEDSSSCATNHYSKYEDANKELTWPGNEKCEELPGLLQSPCTENEVHGSVIQMSTATINDQIEQIRITCDTLQDSSGQATVAHQMTIKNIQHITCTNVENEDHVKGPENGCKNNCFLVKSENYGLANQKTKCNTENRNICETANFDQQNSHTSSWYSDVVPCVHKEYCIFCSQENCSSIKEYLEPVKDQYLQTKGKEIIQDDSCNMCSLKGNKSVSQKCHVNLANKNSKAEQALTSEIESVQSTSSVSGDSSHTSSFSETKSKKEVIEETDPAVLSRRQKQIDYGKNTIGYQRYRETVPKDQRTRQDPQTPPISFKYSRRAWDGLIRAWRRKLHNWDPPKSEGSEDEGCSVLSSIPTISDDSGNVINSLSVFPIGKESDEERDNVNIDM